MKFYLQCVTKHETLKKTNWKCKTSVLKTVTLKARKETQKPGKIHCILFLEEET